jgi:hypothetical protein
MELMDIIVTILIGIGIGISMIVLYAWYLYQDLKGRVDRMIAEVVDEAAADMVGLEIEVDRGRYFCYDYEDKQFVCQGQTVAEIKQAFEVRFPGKTAYLAGGDPAVVEQFRAELAQLSIHESKPNV